MTDDTIREHLVWIAAGHVDGNPLGWMLEATERAAVALTLLELCPAHLESSFLDPVGSPERVVRQVPDGTRP